jgi:hypothetical protein
MESSNHLITLHLVGDRLSYGHGPVDKGRVPRVGTSQPRCDVGQRLAALHLVGKILCYGHALVDQCCALGRVGDEQERALRSVATTAVRCMAEELRPDDPERAEELAMVISHVFAHPKTGRSAHWTDDDAGGAAGGHRRTAGGPG